MRLKSTEMRGSREDRTCSFSVGSEAGTADRFEPSASNTDTSNSREPPGQCGTELRQRGAISFKRCGEVRRGHDVGLRDALGQADAYGGVLIFFVAQRGEPYVESKYFGVGGASRQVVDRGRGVDLVWIVEDGDTREWLGLGAHAEFCSKKRWPGKAECLGCSPLNKRIAEDDGAIAGEVQRAHKFAYGRIGGDLGRAPAGHIDLAQPIEDGVSI